MDTAEAVRLEAGAPEMLTPLAALFEAHRRRVSWFPAWAWPYMQTWLESHSQAITSYTFVAMDEETGQVRGVILSEDFERVTFDTGWRPLLHPRAEAFKRFDSWISRMLPRHSAAERAKAIGLDRRQYTRMLNTKNYTPQRAKFEEWLQRWNERGSIKFMLSDDDELIVEGLHR